jgi:hypothetical protein
MHVHDSALVLEKYNVTYYICPNCGFIQTEDPYWINEVYSKAISPHDTGSVLRNFSNATNLLFALKFIKSARCLDFGGGHGILTNIMRYYGFDFYHYDKYAENLFAAGFDGSLEKTYDLVTAFEIFEHFVNPMEEIEKILKITDALYFSTEIIPKNIPLVKDWHYFSLNTGQHISFYSKKSLEYIAKKFDMYLLTDNYSFHILSRKPLSKIILILLKIYGKITRVNLQWLLKRRPAKKSNAAPD